MHSALQCKVVLKVMDLSVDLFAVIFLSLSFSLSLCVHGCVCECIPVSIGPQARVLPRQMQTLGTCYMLDKGHKSI